MRKSYLTQQELLQHLNSAALEVKSSKDSSKLHILRSHMEKLNLHLQEMASPIPLSLGIMTSVFDREWLIGEFLILLALFGPFWPFLALFGPIWLSLADFWRFLITLDNFGILSQF